MEKGALGLATGSVRAILAISITGVVLYIAITKGTIPDALTGILGSVLGFYFAAGQKGSNG